MTCVKRLDTQYVIGDADGGTSGFGGFYYGDTRHLRGYEWLLPGASILASAEEPEGGLVQVFAPTARHSSVWCAIRRLRLSSCGFSDSISVENRGAEPFTLSAALEFAFDLTDMMGLRIPRAAAEPAVATEESALAWSGRAADGAIGGTRLSAEPAPNRSRPGRLEWDLAIAPGGSIAVGLSCRFSSSAVRPTDEAAVPAFAAFRERFAPVIDGAGRFAPAAERAVRDLHALLHVEGGSMTVAAGLPYFDTPFGRDSLISSMLVLDWFPELAAGSLRVAAATQGSAYDPAALEEPGRIYHELRRGELCRRGLLPFGRYYGSIDSTPLFIVLLGRYLDASGDAGLIGELEPNWRRALGWLRRTLAEGGGFLRFRADPQAAGLKVQSWKDSAMSMCHADGRPAAGDIAVSEVQAYALEALTASARLAEALGDRGVSALCAEEAGTLRSAIEERFWLPGLSAYAMAIDGPGEALAVLSSDSGHLLEAGLGDDGRAAALASSLIGPELFSGWGLRTLGSGEARYDPLSYHNGSIWPHDAALTARGLLSRGFRDEAKRLSEAMLEAVSGLELARAPELISGYSREKIGFPVPHPFACSPQAWSAAAVISLAATLSACDRAAARFGGAEARDRDGDRARGDIGAPRGSGGRDRGRQ